MVKKIYLILTLALILTFSNSLCLSANEQDNLSTEEAYIIDTVNAFVNYLSLNDDNYSEWRNSCLEYGYPLLNYEMDNTEALLYYVKNSEGNIGYVIWGKTNSMILEYSTIAPAYDSTKIDDIEALLYINCIPAVYSNNTYYFLSSAGEVILSYSKLRYYPNLQINNCIVCAISNLLWHYGENGYSSLISGMAYTNVDSTVDSIMSSLGGYTNNNIPSTINWYVSSKSTYSVSVTNQWSPTFYNVQTEVASRPCLLGFAAGSPYSDTVGHMTLCVGTRLYNDWGYVQVIDGHSSYVVEKAWGSYNDFISKVVFN